MVFDWILIHFTIVNKDFHYEFANSYILRENSPLPLRFILSYIVHGYIRRNFQKISILIAVCDKNLFQD